MYQRLMILKAWEDAGLHQSPKKLVRQFISLVERNPQYGWETWNRVFRRRFSAAFSVLIPPIMAIEDNLIAQNLIRHMKPDTERRERTLLNKYVDTVDVSKMQPTLLMVAKLGIKSLNRRIVARPGLSPTLARALEEKSMRSRKH